MRSKLLGYLVDSLSSSRRRKAFNPATRKLFEYGLIGLAIGAIVITGLQIRPQSVFPAHGILQIALTDNPTSSYQGDSSSSHCNGDCQATSLNVTISSIEVHTSGIGNMTGAWTPLCASQSPIRIDVINLRNSNVTLCSVQIQPEEITNVRISIISTTANLVGVGDRALGVPSGKLVIQVSPVASILAGRTTVIVIDLKPHIDCQGNGNSDCKLNPELHANPDGPD